MTRLTLAALAACAAIISIPGNAFAGSDDVVVESPWARAAIGTTRPGAAYFIVHNTGDEAVTLMGNITTPLAMMAQIHRTTISADGVSTMVPVEEILIAPGHSIALEPGGMHAMLMMLQSPMKEGGTFPLILTLEDGAKIPVEVPILGVAARGPDG
ncbi:copper chaperone PCu(A)C [Loktanella sp. M215]|uniref:copper chaperone PCu(A)C n=1 Tax=Loktanella sp. M215 TaxID=2675431 RepID=UPI001F222F51|nr:copper chaperone PCu(A)C [Loktanella sp. M215]MCF7701563.1 copper chaperone PCu(A)C [Loktanella sp. M215]